MTTLGVPVGQTQVGARHFAAFVDGSENSHAAYLATKTLVNSQRGDTLTVVTIDSDKNYLKAQYKSAAIRERYEIDLMTFLPSKRHAFVQLPKIQSAAIEIADFANRSVDRLAKFRKFPAPNFIAVGFSGRKSRVDRDPTVCGQTADLSLRRSSVPFLLVKRPIPAGGKPKHFVMLVRQGAKCHAAASTFVTLLGPDDKLTCLYCVDPNLDAKDEEALQADFGQLRGPTRTHFKSLRADSNVAQTIYTALNDSDDFLDVDFVGVATRVGGTNVASLSNTLVRHFLGNLIILKTYADPAPGYK